MQDIFMIRLLHPVSDFLTRSFNSTGDVGKGVVAKKGYIRKV